jgi:hypothetical protein
VTEAARTGGNRRIDQVLAPGFAENLADLEDDEVRRRRDLAKAEREYVSLLRRLLQGRIEILRAEDARRRGEGEGPVVDRLADILSEGARGPSRGEAPVMTLSADEIALARRRVERLVSDAHLSNLDGLSQPELERSLALLEEEERTVSDTRSQVMEVHDDLQEEMKRRLRAELGPPA